MKRLKRLAVIGSVALNLFVTLPGLVIFLCSDVIRFYIYEQIASRAGETKIVFIGDSITREGRIWGLRIGRPFFTVRNFGQSGFYTEQIRFQAYVASAEKPELAFVMAGINDLPKTSQGVEESFNAYIDIIAILKKGGVEPVIQSTLYRESKEDSQFVEGLNRRLLEYTQSHDLAYLDLNKVLAPEGRLKPEFSRDGTHLTSAAYKVWADLIKEYLSKR